MILRGSYGFQGNGGRISRRDSVKGDYGKLAAN